MVSSLTDGTPASCPVVRRWQCGHNSHGAVGQSRYRKTLLLKGTIGGMNRTKVVDLFCGAGGLTCGLEAAGLTVVEGVDADERCRYPYETNTSARFVGEDVLRYDADNLCKAWGDARYRVLVGCAPCQPFSTYAQKSAGSKAERWALLRRFAALIRETKPDIVSIENVPPLKRTEGYRAFREGLEDVGYNVVDPIVDCREYGAPQMRRRLVLLASRRGPVQIIPPTHAESSDWRDVASAIRHLPVLNAGDRDPGDALHRASKLSGLNLRRIRASTPGGTWRDWPESLQSPCHRRDSGKTYPAVYGRMEWDRPAPTITGQCYGFGNGRFGHPEQDRALTLREAALLQTFPKGFEFFAADGRFPGMRTVGSMIGNAVPPLLGKTIGRSVIRSIKAMGTTGDDH